MEKQKGNMLIKKVTKWIIIILVIFVVLYLLKIKLDEVIQSAIPSELPNGGFVPPWMRGEY